MTYDCDCAILGRDEPRLRLALFHIGYVSGTPERPFTRYTHLGHRRPVIDAMLLNDSTFTKLWAESRMVEILGFQVRVPAPLHLVAMKLHALKQQADREVKDWPDICHLLENHPDAWTRETLNAMVQQYASDKTTEMLRAAGFL